MFNNIIILNKNYVPLKNSRKHTSTSILLLVVLNNVMKKNRF